ncbi:hypothetical protein EBB59_03610 [Lysobacter pythonis]|uniref:Uncharacterized protein n=1 Tax=Solilutibacter pythonis TaxID=2483112 RepID=A0A3M2I1A7_9GAMM|nr:hypothetical protein [Lysobacter pythonis]RMH93750.1 hypothetical protein EBB59_03610 [Lysobacter pythonis]
MPVPPSDAPPCPHRPDIHALARSLALFVTQVSGHAALGERMAARALATAMPDAGREPPPHALALRAWRATLDLPGPPIAPAPPASALPELPPGLRTFALLWLLSDMSAPELAAMLRLPPARCRAAMARIDTVLGGAARREACRTDLQAQTRRWPMARGTGIVGGPAAPGASPESDVRARAQGPMPRAARIALGVVASLTLLAFSATWWLPETWRDDADEPRIHTRPLPAAAAPASRFDTAAAIALHPDHELLNLPDADARIARESAFYAWYQAERLGISSYEPPTPTAEKPEGAATGLPEPIDAP